MRKEGVVRWGVAISIGFFVLLFILAVTQTCNEGFCQSRAAAFWNAPPNEIGDTLAGIAGAMAFLWIIVTVMLQSKELAAQRYELRLTRQEFEGQRIASQAMAASMEQQTEVLKDERKYRDEARADRLVIAKRKRLERIVNDILLYEGDSPSSVEACYLLQSGENQSDVIDALLDFYCNLPEILPPEEIQSYSDAGYRFYEWASEVGEVAAEMQDLALNNELSVGEVENVLAMGLDSLIAQTDRVTKLHFEICSKINKTPK